MAFLGRTIMAAAVFAALGTLSGCVVEPVGGGGYYAAPAPVVVGPPVVVARPCCYYGGYRGGYRHWR